MVTQNAKAALLRCWGLLAIISLALRWHVVTIVFEHDGRSIAVTVFQWLTTAGAVGKQLQRAFPSLPPVIDGASFHDSSHSAALPLSYLVAPDYIPQLISAPDEPPRRFRIRNCTSHPPLLVISHVLFSDRLPVATGLPAGAGIATSAHATAAAAEEEEQEEDRCAAIGDPDLCIRTSGCDTAQRGCVRIQRERGSPTAAGSFAEAPVMDVADLHAAASAIAGRGGPTGSGGAEAEAVAVAFAEQLMAQGFVRLRLPPRRAKEEVKGVTAAAASVFERSRPEKLELSDRMFFPESGHCVCVGKSPSQSVLIYPWFTLDLPELNQN